VNPPFVGRPIVEHKNQKKAVKGDVTGVVLTPITTAPTVATTPSG